MIQNKRLYNPGVTLAITISFVLSAITPIGSFANPSELPTSQQAPEPLEVKWKERGGQILVDSVCFNYAESLPENKGCRRLAEQKFEQECERYRRLYHDSRPYYDQDYWKQMEKYCQAAADFHP